jgi:hypothetical protein
MSVETKSVTPTFDHLIGGVYAFNDMTVLFDFWFDKGASIELHGLLLI